MKVKPGREAAVREYGNTIEKAVAADPEVLAPLKLHYLRWILFEIKGDTYFMYQGIFDTDFDKYIEDAVALFTSTGVTTVFTNLEGFPENWQGNVPVWNKFFRDHQCPSFLEYAEYPYATADESQEGAEGQERHVDDAGSDAMSELPAGRSTMLEFEDIQHITLTRVPAITGRYEFLSFRDPAQGRAWLAGILDKVASARRGQRFRRARNDDGYRWPSPGPALARSE